MKEVHRICDLVEDKSYFEPKEIISIISDVLEKNPALFSVEDKI